MEWIDGGYSYSFNFSAGMKSVSNDMQGLITKRQQQLQPISHSAIYRTFSTNFNSKHRKILKRHYGCVNAVTFDRPGNLLATGGDDMRVLIWKFEDFESTWEPVHTLKGHVSNIFCIQFDSQSKHVYSCGNDGFLMHYDLESLSSTTTLAHEDSALRLSISPISDNILLTAGQDWMIKLWDVRCNVSQGTMERFGRRQNYVEFNPTNPYLFITSDDRGAILLHDIRFAFSVCDGDSHSKQQYLRQYTTRMLTKDKISRPADVTSAAWSPCGNFIGANIQRGSPLIYEKEDPDPICVLEDAKFSSLATIKTGSFSKAFGGLHYFAGSDSGSAFGWEIPRLDYLVEQRRVTRKSPVGSEICMIC